VKWDIFGLEFVYYGICAFFYRGKGLGGESPNLDEINYQICVVMAAGPALEAWDDGDITFSQYVTTFFNAKADCCSEFPEAGFGKCEFLRESCEKAKNNKAVVDDYGSPVEGELLDLLKEACKRAEKDPGKGDSGLSSAAIAGIAVASVAVVGAIVGVLVFFLVIQKKDGGGDDDEKADA
jgi:hypothetical protein